MIECTLGTADGPEVINLGQWYRVARNKAKIKSRKQNSECVHFAGCFLSHKLLLFFPAFIPFFSGWRYWYSLHSDLRVSICDVIRQDDY